MIGGRWEENGRGYEGTGEDAMERGDRLLVPVVIFNRCQRIL